MMGGTVAEGVADGNGVLVALAVGVSVIVGLVVGSGETEGVCETATNVGSAAVGGSVGSGAKKFSITAQPVNKNSNKNKATILFGMFIPLSVIKAL